MRCPSPNHRLMAESPDGVPGASRSPLPLIVEHEARRFQVEDQFRADPQRTAEGWERRFLADPDRAREAIALYEKLGYEVCADPVDATILGAHCDDCALASMMHFMMIYTRKPQEAE
jgi:hypothetical protein